MQLQRAAIPVDCRMLVATEWQRDENLGRSITRDKWKQRRRASIHNLTPLPSADTLNVGIASPASRFSPGTR
jgi:hypothetical protein